MSDSEGDSNDDNNHEIVLPNMAIVNLPIYTYPAILTLLEVPVTLYRTDKM
jgi:hypothetical protein